MHSSTTLDLLFEKKSVGNYCCYVLLIQSQSRDAFLSFPKRTGPNEKVGETGKSQYQLNSEEQSILGKLLFLTEGPAIVFSTTMLMYWSTLLSFCAYQQKKLATNE